MRTLDASRFNAIANLADVRPRLGGTGPLDLAPILANPRNYGFEIDLGGFICVNTFGATYEVHTIFTPANKSFIDYHLLKNANYVTGLIFIFIVGMVLFATRALLPTMLQTLMGYSAKTTGFVTAPT